MGRQGCGEGFTAALGVDHQLVAHELRQHPDRQIEEPRSDAERFTDGGVRVVEPGDREELLGPVCLDQTGHVRDRPNDRCDVAVVAGQRFIPDQRELVVQLYLELAAAAGGHDRGERLGELFANTSRERAVSIGQRRIERAASPVGERELGSPVHDPEQEQPVVGGVSHHPEEVAFRGGGGDLGDVGAQRQDRRNRSVAEYGHLPKHDRGVVAEDLQLNRLPGIDHPLVGGVDVGRGVAGHDVTRAGRRLHDVVGLEERAVERQVSTRRAGLRVDVAHRDRQVDIVDADERVGAGGRHCRHVKRASDGGPAIAVAR